MRTQTRGTIANVRTTLTATTNIIATTANSMAEAIELHAQSYITSAKADIVNDIELRLAERTEAVSAGIESMRHAHTLSATATDDWEKLIYAKLATKATAVVEGMVDAAI